MMRTVLVVGETCHDIQLEGVCARICPEGPVPLLSVTNPLQLLQFQEKAPLGMAGNVASNLKNLGAEVEILTNELVKPMKVRLFDRISGQFMFRFDMADKVNESFDKDKFKEALSGEPLAVVISDYDKGFLTVDDIRWIAMVSDLAGVPTYLDTKKPVGKWVSDVTLVKINQLEHAASLRVHGPEQVEDLTNLIVTRGGEGCTWGLMRYRQKTPREVRDVCGAGDTFLSALALMHVLTKDINRSIDFANHCAGLVVEHHGVVPITTAAGDILPWEITGSPLPEAPDSSEAPSSGNSTSEE